MSSAPEKKFLSLLTRELKAASSEKMKLWSTNYLKGTEHFLGTPLPAVKTIALPLWKTIPQDSELRLSIIHTLLKAKHSEIKVAGMILYQERLMKDTKRRWTADLESFHELFEAGTFNSWNICDWMCLRVLGAILLTDPKKTHRALASWMRSENLWTRRASLVPHLSLLKKTREFDTNIIGLAEQLVAYPDRFNQTAVGWVIRELYKKQKESATFFIMKNVQTLSPEGLRYCCEKMSPKEKEKILSLRN